MRGCTINVGFALGVVVSALVGACQHDEEESQVYRPTPCSGDGDCLNGQACSAGMCVALGDDDPSASTGDDGPADDPSMPATSAGTSPSTSDPSTTDPSTTASSASSSSPTPDCVASDEPTCASSSAIEGCVDGEWVEFDCSDVCADEGWQSEGCDYSSDLGHDACLCSDPPYGACTSDADCSADTPICVQFATGSMCSTSCGDDLDCPWPSQDGSYPICGIPWDTYFCVVECSLAGECPDGTTCYAQDNGNALCL